MRFAIIDNTLVEAESGLKGFCPGCSQPVIAKCGKQRIHHWAHANNRMCDSWWEPETEWHRSWKNNFPVEWQEVFLPNELTGEKHIADVRSTHGFVIEFQHSYIDHQERSSRENFYRDMVWVVDATRLKRDYPRFLKGKEKYFSPTNMKGVFIVDFLDECFPSTWLQSTVPVIFDFRGNEPIDDPKDDRKYLYCLFPIRIGNRAILVEILHKTFINMIINGQWLSWVRDFTYNLNKAKQVWQNQLVRQQIVNATAHLRRRRRNFRF